VETGRSERGAALAIAVVVLGVMMSAIDTTIVILALPDIMRELGASLIEMIWVILIYLLIVTVLATQVGRIGDKYGRTRFYNIGFLVFTVGSALCGLSPSGPALIAFRGVQALGGAFISSNSGAVIADYFPPNRRGTAYGYTNIGWNVGAILGIILGGVITTFVGWRFIFFINVPVGVFAAVAGFRYMEERSPRLVKRLDAVGGGLLGAGLALALLGLTMGAGYGLRGIPLYSLAAGAAVMGAFALWEVRAPDPVIRPELFSNRVFTGSVLAALFQALGNYSVLFLAMMYLQGVRGLTPFQASLLVVPGYIAGGLVGPFVGRLSDRIGARLPASLGLAAQAVGIYVYSMISMNSPLSLITIASVISGVGSGAFYPANSSAVMANSPREHYGAASGVLRTFSNVGMVMSFAVALFIASAAMPPSVAGAVFLGVATISGRIAMDFVAGLRTSFLASITLIVIAVAFSIMRGRERRSS
jgi:EmrB/QacA subfamily drug resistance transporter